MNKWHIPKVDLSQCDTLFDVGEVCLVPGAPREIAQTMTSWESIPGLFS